MTGPFRELLTLYSPNSVQCASFTDASGTGTPAADSRQRRGRGRNTGRQSWKAMRPVTCKAGSCCWSLDGELRSCGNVRCAMIAAKRQQASSIGGCGGRPWSTRPALGVGEQLRLGTRRGCCRFVERASGRRYGSRYQLQMDHGPPYARGGCAEPDNLRLLSGAHDRRDDAHAAPWAK